jgi:hypothetical protein
MGQNWLVTGILGLAVARAATAIANDGSNARALPTLAVEVNDYVQLGPEWLADTEARVTASYRAVGISVMWSPLVNSQSEPKSTNPGPTFKVRVVIMPRDMTEMICSKMRIGVNVTGFATVAAQDARGRVAYIFYDRILQTALAGHAPVVLGLSHVIAHEIGHLLLGRNSHCAWGLMQPEWSPQETHLQTLTKKQVEDVRRAAGTAQAQPGRPPQHSHQ